PFPESKPISSSYTTFTLPFSKDPALHEVYVGGMTSVRMGRLMEDFDTLAGSIAYNHCLPDGYGAQDARKFGIYVVTAAVDRLDMLHPISAEEPEDLQLSGYVANVGKSSMSIFVRLASLSSGTPKTLLHGRFTMACRNLKTGKSHPVPQLRLETEDERRVAEFAKRLKEAKSGGGGTVRDVGPNERESKALHDLFLGKETKNWFDNRATSPKEVVWTRDTKKVSCLMMHPQVSSFFQDSRESYLMRLAYETAWTTASLFARSAVNFLSLDELSFHKPVEIGSLLQLASTVVFSPTVGQHKSFQVNVEATTIKLPMGEEIVTNTFSFTFESRDYLDRYVLPRSYRSLPATFLS
ncbi:Thioesterase/thiol ester dehydrase-isomerase, partial [Atractiella rhizophila]